MHENSLEAILIIRYVRHKGDNRSAGKRLLSCVKAISDSDEGNEGSANGDVHEKFASIALPYDSANPVLYDRQGRHISRAARTSMRKIGGNVIAAFTTVIPSETYGAKAGSAFPSILLL